MPFLSVPFRECSLGHSVRPWKNRQLGSELLPSPMSAVVEIKTSKIWELLLKPCQLQPQSLLAWDCLHSKAMLWIWSTGKRPMELQLFLHHIGSQQKALRRNTSEAPH